MKNRFSTILLCLFILFIFSSTGHSQIQLSFEFAPTIKVKIGTDTLVHPWAGGLNQTQFSDIDIDFDGDLDLFIFDRSGDEISLFTTENDGTGDSYSYYYGGHLLFPSDLRYRVALFDYNQDNKKDIFTYGIGGIKVYKNIGNSTDGLQWELVTNLIYTDYYGDSTNLYVSSSDIPAYVDVEGDGDMDILTFNIGGERLEYHQNQSMELYGVPDSLKFELKNECWGQFREEISTNAVLLNNTSSPCGTGTIPDPQRPTTTGKPTDLNPKHSGSTVLALDINNNNVLDLVLGDVSYPTLTLLTNGGTVPNSNSAMIAQDNNFPSNTTPANIQLFPASYYIDVNHDNVKDLIVSANARTISQNEKSVSYYENLGANNLPNFIFRSKSFLQGDMIEHGLGSIPIVFDQNGDGKRDLLLTHFFRYKEVLNKECTFLLYRNTGTLTQSEYTYLDDDYFSLTTQSLGLRTIPTFGDVDNDGDEDMLLGLESGNILRYTNSAGGGNPVNFTTQTALMDNLGNTINVVGYAAPQLFDLNNDTKLDLIIGRKTGELVYYENTGTSSNPIFTLMNDTLGKVDVATLNPDGYPVPHFFRVNDTTHLFLGSYDGKLHYYKNIDNHLDSDSSFQLFNDNFLNIDVGLYSSFWVEDLDNDGNLDLFVGQDLGGLNHLEVNPNSTTGMKELKPSNNNWVIAPNPSSETIRLISTTSTSSATEASEVVQLIVGTISGQLVTEQQVNTNSSIDVSNWKTGMYLITIESNTGVEVVRFVKQ